MQLVGDVKCYHCGHISGQVEASRREKRLVLHRFLPRPGFQGEPPRAGQRLRCERCAGPVFLEDLHPAPPAPEPMPLPVRRKRGRPAARQAAA